MKTLRSIERYWRLLSRYLRPQRRRMALLALVLAAGIAVQVITPLLAARFIDRATSGGVLRDLVVLAILTMALAIAGQAVAVLETYVAESVSWSATNALRLDLLDHLLHLDASFHNAHSPGALIERVDGDAGTLARFFSRFVVYVVGNALLMAGVLVLLFFVGWRIGLALTAFLAIALVIMLKIRAAASPIWAQERQATADFYGFVGEYLSGLEDLRASGAAPFVLRRCAEEMRRWFAITLRAQMRGYGLVATSQGLFALGTVAAFAISAMLYRDGTLTIGSVFLVFRYTEMLRHPTEQIRNEVQDLQQADASIGRIEALLATESRLVERQVATLAPGPLSVELERVSFAYGDAPALHEIDLRVRPGSVLGIVGRTGSGKTSLTRLLPRFYDPSEGIVRIGGVDVRDLPIAELRARIGIVTQEVHLFSGNIRDNLTLFDDRVDDSLVIEVINGLGLDSWLDSLPRGLDTPLGAAGAGLSAGEAQILACARVFLRDPDLVILDESSSRLDPATERIVHDALGRLLEGRTGIIVAHKLSTLEFADEITVVEDGRIVEHGPRVALAADPSSRYSMLLDLASEEALV